MTDFTYDVPILSREHAAFCRAEAERRYGGKIVRDGQMLIVVNTEGDATGTDAVLRALSFYPDREEFRTKFNAAREIADPVEREATQRQLFDEFSDAVRAEARAEMEHMESVWAKYLSTFKGSLYMVLADGETFTALGECQIVNFPHDWTEQQIDASLRAHAENEDAAPAHPNVVWWFDN
jgi:hypothetical protein